MAVKLHKDFSAGSVPFHLDWLKIAYLESD